jgi:hypothetical protein
LKVPEPDSFTLQNLASYLGWGEQSLSDLIYGSKVLRLAFETTSVIEFCGQTLCCSSTSGSENSWLRPNIDILQTYDELDPDSLLSGVASREPQKWATPAPEFLYVDLAKASIRVEDNYVSVGHGRVGLNSTVKTKVFETFSGDQIEISGSDGEAIQVELRETVITRDEWNRIVALYEAKTDKYSSVLGLLSLALIQNMGDLVLKKSGTKLSKNRLAEEIVGLSPKVTGVSKTKVSGHIESGLRTIKHHNLL